MLIESIKLLSNVETNFVAVDLSSLNLIPFDPGYGTHPNLILETFLFDQKKENKTSPKIPP
jgi:hypothetical protein